MDRVIIVDDDITQITLVRTILTKSGYEVISYNSPVTLLEEYKPGMADILLSDINMPGLSGMELVHKVREVDLAIPIVMLTASSRLNSVVDSFKEGISDYLVKPVIPVDLVHRVGKIIQIARRKEKLHKVEVEKDLVELENKKLISWKNLYASKDITQTKQMMKFFSRTINTGGGYLWLDFLKSKKADDNGNFLIDSDLYNLIIEAATAQKKSFDFMSYISELPELDTDEYEIHNFNEIICSYCTEQLQPIISNSNKTLSINLNNLGNTGTVKVDMEKIKDILLELIVNAMKYSKDNSKVIIELYRGKNSIADKNIDSVIFTIRNIPRSEIGIPYDYTELVFDLFYTMESYTVEHPQEKWSHGSGLYISRAFINKMGGWINCNNMIDYTEKNSGNYVLFKLSLPII